MFVRRPEWGTEHAPSDVQQEKITVIKEPGLQYVVVMH
jgi:hypothetical protein